MNIGQSGAMSAGLLEWRIALEDAEMEIPFTVRQVVSSYEG